MLSKTRPAARSVAITVLCVAAFLSTAGQLLARPGNLDLTFNQTGYVHTGFGGGYDQVCSTVLQSDGKIVFVNQANLDHGDSEFSVGRINQDGSLDLSFGGTGLVYTSFRKGSAYPLTAALQPDGKIVVAGVVYYYTGPLPRDGYQQEAAIVRYNTDGSLDDSFGLGGKMTMPSVYYRPIATTVQPDGRIILSLRTGNDIPYVARLNADGSPDLSFGNSGIVHFQQGLYLGSIALQPDGKIVFGGSRYQIQGSSAALLRINSDGSLDTGFGDLGLLIVPITFPADASSVRIQPDGKFVLVTSYGDLTIFIRLNPDGSLDPGFGDNGQSLVNVQALVGPIGLSLYPDGRMLAISRSYNSDDSRFFAVRVMSNGSPDTTFGGNGLVVRTAGTQTGVTGFVVSSSGKIVGAGYSRYSHTSDVLCLGLNDDGTPDDNFGDHGVSIIDASDAPAYGHAMRLQTNGKIVVAGTTINGGHSSQSLLRYNEDGSLDTSFNGTGKVVTSFDFDSYTNALEIQNDGRLVVAGSCILNDRTMFMLSRYMPDGSLDPSFGANGIVITHVSRGNDAVGALAIQSDGKLVALGASYSLNYNNRVDVLVRYNSDGTLDEGFGRGGIVQTRDPSYRSFAASAVALQPDGRIVVEGFLYGANRGLVILRYNSDGSLDASFSGTGVVLTPPGIIIASDIKIQADGRIIAVGATFSVEIGWDVVIVRFDNDGNLDPTFGGTGIVKTPLDTPLDTYHFSSSGSVALMPNGDYAVVSSQLRDDYFDHYTESGSFSKVLMYRPDGSLDRTWGKRGIASIDVDGGAFLTSLSIDSFGRLVAGGTIANHFGVARFEGLSSLYSKDPMRK